MKVLTLRLNAETGLHYLETCKGNFLVDTGASSSYIKEELLIDFGDSNQLKFIQKSKEVINFFGGGTYQPGEYFLNFWVINLTGEDVEVTHNFFSIPDDAVNENFSGVLGIDYLKNCVINFVDSTVTLKLGF